jgi:RNA polymerase sigma-70 factor (family 1)
VKREIYNDNKVLIECLKNGDEKAYAYLMDNYHHQLCVYANSLIKNRYSAEDIVQNVFIRVWELRIRLNPNFSIKSFLYKSVYNEFIDLYRKNQSLIPIEKIYFNALNSVVKEDDSEAFDRIINVLNKEIQNLPPKCKNIFILSKKEGLTNIEIAEHLEISIKTVETQITKAFSILRSTLEDKIKGILFLLFGFRKSILKSKIH